MRIYTVGKTANSDIVVNSQFVSTNHAELWQLDNGDLLLVDTNSSNGTFVNGVRIAPGQEVTIRRGDDVRFADVQFNWSSMPSFMPDPNAQKLISIGSHNLNSNIVSGSGVSRFHATIKQTRDNKWFICDHSSNGTTINGVRLPKDQWLRFKKGDSIMCAGIPIQNPATGGFNGKLVAVVVGVCAVVAALVLLLPEIIKPKEYLACDLNKDDKVEQQEIYSKYSKSTALLVLDYYYRVSVPELPNLPVWEYVWDEEGDELTFYNGSNSMSSAATAFFISQDGYMVTNLHVARPWLFGDTEVQTIIKSSYMKSMNDSYSNLNLSMSDIKADGVVSSLYAIPTGHIFDISNATKCQVIVTSNNKDVDLAVLQTVNKRLPEGATIIPPAEFNVEEVAVGASVFTMGFPGPIIRRVLENINEDGFFNETIQAGGTAGVMTTNNNRYEYGFDAASYHGASGSPIFDQNGKLISVVCSGFSATQGYNRGVKAKYINQLLTKAQE